MNLFTINLYLLLITTLLSVYIPDIIAAEDELPVFSNIQNKSGIPNVGKMGQTAVWGDYNSDGWLDLFISNMDSEKRRSRRKRRYRRRGHTNSNIQSANTGLKNTQNSFLFENQHGEAFQDVLLNAGIPNEKHKSASWADFNNDGFLDMAIATFRASMPPLLLQNYNGYLLYDVSKEAGITKTGSTATHVLWVDYDNDGLIDLFQPSKGVSYLYHNLGDGLFEEVSAIVGLGETFNSNSGLWFDANNDGFQDLFLANGDYNRFYLNNGEGSFSEVTEQAGLLGGPHWRTTSACAGDYNSDGFLDLYITNIGSARRNALYRNNGDGTFTDMTWESGTADVGDGRTCAWLDFDADGKLDLFTTNHIQPTKFYRNLGDGRFQDVAVEVGIDKPIDVFAATWGDYDKDGFLDVFLNGHIGTALMKNSGNSNNSVTIRLVGGGYTSNTSAIGSRVMVTTKNGEQIREVSGGRGCCEQDMLPVYFGLGKESEFDVDVSWPGGKECVFKGLSAHEAREYVIHEISCRLIPQH